MKTPIQDPDTMHTDFRTKLVESQFGVVSVEKVKQCGIGQAEVSCFLLE